MKTVRCPQCNLANWETEALCKRCGRLLEPPAEANVPPDSSIEFGGAPQTASDANRTLARLYDFQPNHYGHRQNFKAAEMKKGMAIASMVLGILWLYWIGSILALVFGYIAKKQIRERGESGGGMATAGIVLGWIGVGTLDWASPPP